MYVLHVMPHYHVFIVYVYPIYAFYGIMRLSHFIGNDLNRNDQ